jgi:hypothetical protein
MRLNMKISAIALAVAMTGSAAHAQDVYAGVAFDYGKPHAGDDQTAASLMAGVSYEVGTLSFGAEVEYGASATFGGDYDTARLRLIGAYDFGGVTALASIGGTRYDAGADTFTGYNYGIGAQVPVTAALDVRAEIMRDMMDDYGTNVTTTRLAAIYSF